jgi:hypothetical protein
VPARVGRRGGTQGSRFSNKKKKSSFLAEFSVPAKKRMAEEKVFRFTTKSE